MPRPKSQSKDEKYTPHKYIDAVKSVLGQIELDPASCEAANNRVKALNYYSIESNDKIPTLDRIWKGKVFLNPPYSRGNLPLWTNKLINSHLVGTVREGILLIPNWTERKWFQPLWKYPICFTDHRIDYVDGFSMKLCGNPEGGSCFVFFWNIIDKAASIDRFYLIFSRLGHVVLP